MSGRKMSADRVARLSALIWPEASHPATLTEDFEHTPEFGIDDEAPEEYEILACSCGEVLARIPRGGGYTAIYEEHLRRCGQ